MDLWLGLLDRDLLRSSQAVPFELVEEWLGEVGVGTAAAVQVGGSPGKRRLLDVVTGGPSVPGVERCEGVLGDFDAAVGIAECSEELAALYSVLAEPVAFAVELGALVEEGSGAMGQFLERDLGGCNTVSCVGDRVSGSAPVESAAAGEVLLGLSVSASSSFEIAGQAGDGPVVWGATWGELGELLGELVDALLDAGLLALLNFDGGSGVSEFATSVVLEIMEPVRDRTPRLQRGGGRCGGGEFASDSCGGEVGSVGGEDLFEDVDRVGDVVGVGDDADEVLVAAAGYGDVQTAAGGGWGGDGDGAGGGV